MPALDGSCNHVLLVISEALRNKEGNIHGAECRDNLNTRNHGQDYFQVRNEEREGAMKVFSIQLVWSSMEHLALDNVHTEVMIECQVDLGRHA